ncbi:hypothetical protein FSB78_13140 [Sphingomonas ginsenosidivorax]|uniref:Uncharacterized protein n=1 Tax=Sphingomonas ginsenosidivorax TaxID=862135 RepID=A0A5C6UHU5_9SPHN|nr:hypothetical protein [Sphingomonas ginsenosidivorax]TXC71791.1 hypothetical protein FSB78_13140 [Sphingomonas ginsenosidivorax]
MKPIRAIPLLALALIACDKAPAGQDLNSLDAELTASNTGNARDPALTAALADQIMVDPTLAQSSNGNAVRPPPRPASGAVPPDGVAPRTDPTDPATLKKAPAPSGDCPECKAAKGALTLGALAERQANRRTAACAGAIGYSAGWANRLPADLPLYPDARLAEAAGADQDGCRLRVVSFASAATVDRLIDFYYTRATKAGYSTGHRTDGAQHVLGGTRGEDAYVVYVTARSGGGSEVDLVSNAGI